MEKKNHICLNCGTVGNGNYCPRCGKTFEDNQDNKQSVDTTIKYCPKCGAVVRKKYCTKCGTLVEEQEIKENPIEPPKSPFGEKPIEPPKSPFEMAKDSEQEKKEKRKSRTIPVFSAIKEDDGKTDNEQAFANGLPEWNLEPPIIVRRVKK